MALAPNSPEAKRLDSKHALRKMEAGESIPMMGLPASCTAHAKSPSSHFDCSLIHFVRVSAYAYLVMVISGWLACNRKNAVAVEGV